jgi:hypothetical protein
MGDLVSSRNLLWAGLLLTTLCFASLAVTRLYRVVPVFAFYLLFVATATIVGLCSFGQSIYWTIYLAACVLDYLCGLAVMWELASHVAAYRKNDVPQAGKSAGILIVAIFAITGILLALSAQFNNAEWQVRELLKADLAFDIFRVFFFTAILILSTVVGMRWRHIVLKVASCLSLYSAIALAARAVQEYADRLKSLSAWFVFADRVPILAWSILMIAMTWQIVYCQPPSARLIHLNEARSRPSQAGIEVKS